MLSVRDLLAQHVVSVDLEYPALLSLYRLMSKARATSKNEPSVARPKLAILGSYTTQ